MLSVVSTDTVVVVVGAAVVVLVVTFPAAARVELSVDALVDVVIEKSIRIDLSKPVVY